MATLAPDRFFADWESLWLRMDRAVKKSIKNAFCRVDHMRVASFKEF